MYYLSKANIIKYYVYEVIAYMIIFNLLIMIIIALFFYSKEMIITFIFILIFTDILIFPFLFIQVYNTDLHSIDTLRNELNKYEHIIDNNDMNFKIIIRYNEIVIENNIDKSNIEINKEINKILKFFMYIYTLFNNIFPVRTNYLFYPVMKNKIYVIKLKNKKDVYNIYWKINKIKIRHLKTNKIYYSINI